MQLQTAIFILVAALFQYGDCQVCVNTNTCLPPVAGTPDTYNNFGNAQCTGTAINVAAALGALPCPATFPSCFGGLFGVITGGTVAGTGPCLATPTCTTAGVFPILNGNGTRNTFACGAFYVCTAPGAISLNLGCTTFGDEFNAVTRVCGPPATAGCSLPLPAPGAPGAPVPPGPPGAPVPPVAPGAAPACSGLGAKVADPTSCRHYFKCGLFGRRTRRRCLFNQIFSTVSNNCSSGTNCGTRPLV